MDAFGLLFDGLQLAARPTSQVIEPLALYGAPVDEGLQVMASDWPSQAVHAVLQATSPQYRRMRKVYKQEAVERLKAAEWALGPEALAERLNLNLLIVLTCRTSKRGAAKVLSKAPVAVALKEGRPWIILATDGSGLQWHAVADRHRNYMLPWPVGAVLNEAAQLRSCTSYKVGALVGYQGTTWRVIAAAGPSGAQQLTVEDTKNSARQATVGSAEIESARPPVAESAEAIANRAEEIKRRASGNIEPYATVTYALEDLQALIAAEE